jgi:hypothetical protein
VVTVVVDADASVGMGSGCKADEEVLDEAKLGLLPDDLRGSEGGGVEYEGERACWRRWGVLETWRPMAICSMVGRAVVLGRSRKEVSGDGWHSWAVEYMSMDLDSERA